MFQIKHKSMKWSAASMAFALILLSGCTSDFGPWPMPTGYTYHAAEYKAPPGPEPVFKKWEMAHKKNAQASAASSPPPSMDTHFDNPSVEIADSSIPAPHSIANDPQLWLSATKDLTDRLFGKFGTPTEAVYLPPGTGEEGQFFAASLHAALQERGITIAEHPGTGPFTLHYTTSTIDGAGDGRLLLTVAIQSGQQTLSEESGIYTVGGGIDAAGDRTHVENVPMSLTIPVGR